MSLGGAHKLWVIYKTNHEKENAEDNEDISELNENNNEEEIIYPISPRTSWALWNNNGNANEDFFNENKDKLHAKVVYLEYNRTNKLKNHNYKPYIAYHCNGPHDKRVKEYIQDKNLKNIIGCYITDLLIRDDINNNPIDVLKEQLKKIDKKYKNRYIICSGSNTFDFLKSKLDIISIDRTDHNIQKAVIYEDNEKWFIYRVWRNNWGANQKKNIELGEQLKFINDNITEEEEHIKNLDDDEPIEEKNDNILKDTESDENNNIIKKTKKTKEKIPVTVKNTLWSLYFNNNLQGICQCCKTEIISKNNFDCGHIISEKNGGKVHIENLKPICRACNSSMGTTDMNEFMIKYGFDKLQIKSKN